MRYKRVILICVDALGRKYQRLFEPYFNVVYSNYFSSHSWTLPGHVAMLSGVNLPELSHVFDVTRLEKWKDYVKNIPTIASTFHSVGFTTRAVTSGGYLSRYFGWGYDWDEWLTPEEGYAEWNGEFMLPQENELLFLHTYYVHNWFMQSAVLTKWFKKNDHAYDLGVKYDVSYMDQARQAYEKRVSTLVKRLSWVGDLSRDTLVVLTSYHGEIFSKKGQYFHHGDMARNNQRVFSVPLCMRVKAGRAHDYIEPRNDLSLKSLIEQEFGLHSGR